MRRNSPILGIPNDHEPRIPYEREILGVPMDSKKDFDHAVKMLRSAYHNRDTEPGRHAYNYWKDQITKICAGNEPLRMSLYEIIGII